MISRITYVFMGFVVGVFAVSVFSIQTMSRKLDQKVEYLKYCAQPASYLMRIIATNRTAINYIKIGQSGKARIVLTEENNKIKSVLGQVYNKN